MKRKRRKRTQSQSLTRNVALLFLSLVILVGASVLFSVISDHPKFSYDPLESRLSKLVAKSPEKTLPDSPKSEKAEPRKSSFEYSYWDILLLQDKGSPSGSEDFSIQIAAFKSEEAAKKYAAELESKTHLRCTISDTGKWFAVRWGSFRSRETAERYCSTLSSKLQRECIVTRM
ncbi:MAG TPA: SPOR domain-containing protein [Deltaproteobacteria bacterium]|jgi:cell division septation protein DedD|nr:SPOR domain-containing protein [Deltaproteobacteria bacterium]HQH99978.1 SPOR domain-containing protein [Deltaproteobacteria bacterium]